jgi:hypothetical protein
MENRTRIRKIKIETVPTEVHQSKWGYHPCDYETYQKLRKINYVRYLSIKMQAAWNRWRRKEPQNRVIRKWTRNADSQRTGYEIIGPRPEPERCPVFSDKWSLTYSIERDYENAKVPRRNKEDVQALRLSKDDINELYEECIEWLKNN